MILFAKQTNNLTVRDALLAELRTLQETWPDDDVVRDRLGRTLYNVVWYLTREGHPDMQLCNALAGELEQLKSAGGRNLAIAISFR